MRGLFSDIHWENLFKLLEVKPTEVWALSDDWVPPGDINSQTCPH